MTANDQLIDRIAQSVLDGDAVDWAAESSGGAALDRLRHLRTVAALAQTHRLERWGHLKIVEAIGRGSSGTVYRAWDTRLDRDIALKLVPAEPASTGALASAIIHEGRLLARVQHPNVVTIHGADRLDGYVGLWMELVRGRTLEESLRAGVVYTADEVMRIGLAVGRALAAVHAAGLLHRDVKAQNVMQADEGRIVLMDFGTGRDLADTGSDLTGTPLYLAPEVFQGQAATPQSDVYSLGVLLYRLLSRSYPVQGRTIDDVRRAHESSAPASVDVLRAPRPLRRIIARAVDPRPDGRYPTAAAFSTDLERARQRLARRRWIWRSAAAMLLLAPIVWIAQESGWVTGRPGTSRLAASIIAAFGVPPPAVLPAGERPVIAVAPFRNLTASPNDDLIVEGLTYEVVRSLAGLDGLDVRSAASSLAADSEASAAAFGRQMGANLVLEASVLRSSGRLRVNAQLIRVADAAAVLPMTFESDDQNALALQERLSLAIVNRLRLHGLGRRRYQLDPQLSDAFFAARALQARRRTDHAAKAVALFEQLIDADPMFAPAHAGLASALGAFSMATPTAEAPPPDPRMRPAAMRAIELDPLLAEAHAALGGLYARDREWDLARASFTTAMKLDQTLTTAHSDFVLAVLLPRGELDEAMRVIAAAQRADPLSLDVRRVMALVQVDTGRYTEAIESARWVIERDPEFPFAELWLGRALLLGGRPDEAAPILQNKNWGYRGYLYAVTGRRAEAEALVAAHPDDPAGQMLVYGGLNDADRAYEALERAADIHWWRAATWMRRPEVAVLRGDPRVAALRVRMGLTP